jgi:hypothetical protein
MGKTGSNEHWLQLWSKEMWGKRRNIKYVVAITTCLLFVKSTNEIFNVHGSWHSPNTLPTTPTRGPLLSSIRRNAGYLLGTYDCNVQCDLDWTLYESVRFAGCCFFVFLIFFCRFFLHIYSTYLTAKVQVYQ